MLLIITLLTLVSSARPGGVSRVNANDDGVQSAAARGVDLVSAQRNGVFDLAVTRVVRATKQVVAGLKYSLVVEVGESHCGVETVDVSDCVGEDRW